MLAERTRSQLLQHRLLPPHRTSPRGGGLILLYNTMFGVPISMPASGLPAGFELTTDLRRFEEARAVVFHIPSLGRIDRLPKPEGQLWVAWWMESERHSPRLADPRFMRRFEFTMSHRLDADVPVPYVGGVDEALLRAPPRPKRELAALFMSRAEETSGRAAYAAEMMRYIEVHSYGRLLRNRKLRHDCGRASKLETIASYRFTLAFENAIEEDYVTEKLYDPLVAGSVPVYLGPPNAERLAPSPESYIDVRDHRSPRAVAEHLHELAADEEAYSRHLAWKDHPFQPGFTRLLELQHSHPLIRLCELIATGSSRDGDARAPVPGPQR